MFDRFTERARKVIGYARSEAHALHHDYIGTEHILLGLIREGQGVATNVLEHLGCDLKRIRDEIGKTLKQGAQTEAPIQVPFTPRAKKVLELAGAEAQNLQHNYVGTEHLLLALLREQEGLAAHILLSLDIQLDTVRTEVIEFLGGAADTGPHSEQERGDEVTGEQASPSSGSSRTQTLDQYGRDLTEAARRGDLDPVIGRADEIERVVQVLSRRTKNNPVLLGEPGVGKTAIVEGLAQSIITGKVPELLRDRRIVSLDLAGMVAGTKYRGQFEERIKGVMQDVTRAGNVVLFIDEIHTLVGAGGAEGAIDAANVLKPALSRGEIQLIGATTLDEYRKNVEKDGALERRFQSIIVDAPCRDDAVAILDGLSERYASHHKVIYTSQALESAVDMSIKYINNRFLPDKAIDVIDEAGARLRLRTTTPPPDVTDLEARIEELEGAKDAHVQDQEFEEASRVRDEMYQLRKEVEEKMSAWRADEADESQRPVVDTETIAETVAKMTGIPVTNIAAEEAERLLEMEATLSKTVVHQEEAIDAVARAVRRSRSGLKDPNRPTGSFLFLGPSGVGKTWMSKQLSQFMFGSEEALLTFDMSEYMEKHNASRLIGSPPGYVGYEEGGQLTEQVRRRPYSVILFDEIEKAHPDVYNMLLQIMEEGRLTDSFGRHIDFRNTIVIMTSNVGANVTMGGGGVGFHTSEEEVADKIKTGIMDEVNRFFRPEFLNRMDEIINFNPLDRSDLFRIISIEMDKVEERLRARGLVLHLSDRARDFLIGRGFNPQYGARPLRRAIERYVEDPLAEEMLRGLLPNNSLVELDHIEGEDKLVFKAEDARDEGSSDDDDGEGGDNSPPEPAGAGTGSDSDTE